jgi:hypothetical protein
VFANFTDVAVSNFCIDLVESDTCHPSLVIDLSIFLPSDAQSQRFFATMPMAITRCFILFCRAMTGHVFTASPLLTSLLHSLTQQYLKLWI